MIYNLLSIAGSDPSGGAGIQADLKVFSALGGYGMSVITALTAQNTQGVRGVEEVSPAFVTRQLEAVFDDIRVDAVKIGMAGSAATISAIAAVLGRYNPAHIVLDPVMVATSGDALLSDAATEALKAELLPLCSVLTPNIPEAKVLLGVGFDAQDISANARAIVDMGAAAVLLKGGHGGGARSVDVYADALNEGVTLLDAPRVETENTHGTGCTLSSAISVYLAQGLSAPQACEAAKIYITKALQGADDLDVGRGHGPVKHF